VVPHITDAIQDWVTKVAGEPVEKTNQADVCLIEVSKHQQNTTIPLFLLENLSMEWLFFMSPTNKNYLETSSGTAFSKYLTKIVHFVLHHKMIHKSLIETEQMHVGSNNYVLFSLRGSEISLNTCIF